MTESKENEEKQGIDDNAEIGVSDNADLMPLDNDAEKTTTNNQRPPMPKSALVQLNEIKQDLNYEFNKHSRKGKLLKFSW